MSFGKSYFEPVYLISEVATILNIHPQTLRQYEREGLVTPSRTTGKIRLYSQKDIDIIKNILLMTRIEGINIAGVCKILKLEEQIKKLQFDIEKLTFNPIDKNNKALVIQQRQYDIVVFKPISKI
jgi:MerR family transcriptional regulator/heat shock protein HspR